MINVFALIFWIGFPLILTVVGYWGIQRFSWDDNRQPVAVVMLILGIIFLGSAFIVIPVNRCEVISDCQKFKATKEFCETKTYMTETEHFALAQKAVEQNQWLTKAQYWRRNPIFSIFWPEEVDTLKMIK